jgi:hypothetical protein
MDRMQAQLRVEELQAVVAENSATRLRHLQAHWQTARRVEDADGVDMTRVDQSFASRLSMSGGPHMDQQERGELVLSPTPLKPSRGSKFARSSLLLSSSDEDTNGLEDRVDQFPSMDRASDSSTPRTPPRKKSTEMSDQASALSPLTAEPALDGAEARLIEEYIGRCTKDEVQRALLDAQGHGGRARKKLNLLTKGRTMESPELERARSSPPKLAWAATADSGSRRNAQQEPKVQPRPRRRLGLQPQPEPEPEPAPESAVQKGSPVTSAG